MIRALDLLSKEREKALARVAGAHLKLCAAREEYAQAVMEADQLGIGPSEIARNIGLSETAIRSFIKRRKAE